MRTRGSAASATPAPIVAKKGKCIKVELKQVESLLLKKQRASSLTMSRKRKEVLAVETPFDRMGCRMEKAVVAYQQNLIKSMDKFVVESGHRNHVMDWKNLVMIGLVFYEVSRRWFEKGPNKDQGGEGDGDKEEGSEDENEELRKINDAFNKVGGDVSVGMWTMQKNMDCLLKRATDVVKRTKLSRHVAKEFINRMDPMVDECEMAFYERCIRKEWKRKTYPDNVNLDAD
ncbi:hypothetical protein Scep_005147 [Stephania cephalantha]|uniref:Uncharacterized protein n=1 Tax=Stephania cephalantha TaxID=152367 RepID=A0AAP0PW31_9MAGN